jgi:MerR family transcriptional regulator, light-induced transcriptional regulator
MSQFSIKDIEHLTGIRAHTLRIWEQRYNVPRPKRTPGNVRFYDDEDLRLLLNIATLNKHGHRISEIARMSVEELGRKAFDVAIGSGNSSIHIQSLVSCMLDLDEATFNRVLGSSILQSGLERTMMEVIFPFMSMIGVLWQSGTLDPAYEHFMSCLIRQKLIVAIDAQDVKPTLAPKNFLLLLPEGEFHELGLLFGNYLIRAAGHRALYLGTNLPLPDLERLSQSFNPDFILTSLTAGFSRVAAQQVIDDLVIKFPGARLLLTGNVFLNSKEHFKGDIDYVHAPSDLQRYF